MQLKAKFLNRLKGWRFSGTSDGQQVLASWPCNFWAICAQRVDTVILRDPHYGQEREFSVFAGCSDGREHRFAYAEVSNGVFAVFEPV